MNSWPLKHDTFWFLAWFDMVVQICLFFMLVPEESYPFLWLLPAFYCLIPGAFVPQG